MTDPAAALTLPEEVLLLSLNPVSGSRLCQGRFLQYAVAGAVLAELELSGHIAEERGRAVVTHPIPPGDPLLADALASLGVSAKGRRAGSPRVRAWVRRAARRQEEEWLARLIERGALRAETRRFLGFVPYHRFPAGQAERSTEVRQRFDAALHAGLPTPRERKLAALVAAAGVTSRLYPSWDQQSVRRSLRRLVHEEWTALAVYRNVREDRASQAGGGG